MIDTTKLESPVIMKEEIIPDDDWKFSAVEKLPGKMKRRRNSTVETELSPDILESSKKSKSKKKRKHHSREEIIEKVERNIDDDENSTQDIIESSQPPVSCKKKRRSSNKNSEINFVRSLQKERIESEYCRGTETEEFLQNPAAVGEELRGKNSRDGFDKKLGKQSEKKMKRITISIDTESDSNHDCNLRENENPNYQSHVKTNDTNLVERKKKSKSKTRRNNSWDDAFTDFFRPMNKRHDDNDAKALNDSPEVEEIIESNKSTENKAPCYNTLNILFKDVKREPEVSREDKKRKRREKVERKKSNTLLAMINDSTSNSDSDHVQKRIVDSSEESLNTGNLRRHSKSKAGKVLSISDDEDENQSSLSKSDKTLDNYRSESHKGDRKRLKHNAESSELGRTIKYEESSDDAVSNCGLTNISVKNSAAETKALKRDRNRKARVKADKKEPSTPLKMADDGSIDPDSDHKVERIIESSDESMNMGNLKSHGKSKAGKVLSISDDEDENQSSLSKSDKTLDNYRSESHKGDRKRLKHNAESSELGRTKKYEESSDDVVSDCGLTNISVKNSAVETKALERDRNRKARVKADKKEPSTPLKMADDGSIDPDSDHKVERIIESSDESMNMGNLKSHGKSKAGKVLSISDDEDENQSSLSKSDKTLDNYRSESHKGDRKRLKHNAESSELGRTKKYEESSDDVVSDCGLTNISVKNSAAETKALERDRNRKARVKADKKEPSTPLKMADDGSIDPDSDHKVERIIESSDESMNMGNLRSHSKSKAGKVLSISDDEDENQSSLSKSDKTLDNYRSESHKGDRKRLKHNAESFELGRTIKYEEPSDDAASDCGSTNISVKNSAAETKALERDRNRKARVKADKKEPSTPLKMADDGSIDPDSDHKVERIIESSDESMNMGNLRSHSKSKAGKVLSISDDEDENQSSLSKSDKTLDNYRSESHKGDRKRLKHNAESFELGRTIKYEEPSDDAASDCGSTNISVKNSTAETKALRKDKKRTARVKTKKKESNTLLAMMNDSSNSSDSDHGSKSISISNENSLDKRKQKKKSKSKVTKILLSSDEEKEINSSQKKAVKDENSVSSSKINKALDNSRSKIDESDEKSSGDNWETPVFRETKKRNKSSVNEASNYDSADDIKPEPEVLRKKRKHKAKHKVKKQESNTLLAMMNDDKNSSDVDDEKKNIVHTFKKSPNERSLKGISKRRISESFSDTDKEEEKDQSSNTSPPKAPLGKIRKFDLEEEAKDLEEMIIALEEEEQVPKETMRKLRGLQVQLRHTVPPQHQVETCAGSRGPTPEQKEMIEKFGPIKCGKFTPEEDDLIVKNWKSFCKLHNWDSRDVRPFLYMRHREIGFMAKFTERLKFVQFLADGLPWRTLYSVYWRFRNLYQPHIQTKYTEDEDKLIIAHMENSSAINTKNVRKFSELAKILNRTRASVWRRYRLLKRKRDPCTKIKWDLHLLRKMIKNLMQYTLCDDVSQLKDLEIPFAVWNKLSEKFKINCRDLKEFWLTKLHIQLFSPEPVYMNDVKIKLIEYFYTTGITEWWEIEWPNITKHFDGMTSSFLAKIFNNMVQDEKLEGIELTEILEHLYEVKKPQLQNAPKDKCLPRIVFENGNVKVLDTTTSDGPKKKKSTKRSSTQVAQRQKK